MTPVQPVPSTFEEFYEHYDAYITSAIHKISRGFVRADDVEDLKQQIYTRVVETDYLNLVSRKIQERKEGSFTTYLFALIRSVLSNQFDRNTRNPLNTAIGVVETSPSDEKETNALVLESFAGMISEGFERSLTTADYLDQFSGYLRKTYADWGPDLPFPDGSLRKRSLSLVFQLLREDKDPAEIAELLQVTSGSVFGYINKLKIAAQEFETVNVKTV